MELLKSVELSTLLGTSRFIRKGVSAYSSPYSCLECLLQALEYKESVDSIKKKIEKLASYNLSSQTMMFPSDINKIIKNNETIDPLPFLNLLENLFQVNIILFCNNKYENVEGSFCNPFFIKYLIMNYKNTVFLQTVLLFRTFGSEVDKVNSPKIELIVLEKSEKDKPLYENKISGNIILKFNTNTTFIEKLKQLYNSTINTDTINVKFINKLTSQLEDNNGKIRVFNIKIQNNNNNITIYTSPVSPLDYNNFENRGIVYDNIPAIKKYSNSIIKSFFESEKIEPKNIKKILYFETKLIGYFFIKDDLQGFVYCEDNRITNDITSNVYDLNINEYISPLGVGSSLLNQYNMFIRLSNMLVSYTLYLFSRRYNTQIEKLFILTNNSIFNTTINKMVNDFGELIVIQPDHQYNTTERILSLKNTSFVKDTQYLIIVSQEIKKRLLFSLHSYCKNDLYYVFNYKSKKYIPNYYTTSKDFKQSEHYTIYYTRKELAIYNIDPTLIYKSYSLPPSSSEETFFLSNQNIENGRTFLAQKVPSIENSIFTSTYFKKYRINTSDRTSEGSLSSVNLMIFSYDGTNIDTNSIIIDSKLKTVYIFLEKHEYKIYYYSLLEY